MKFGKLLSLGAIAASAVVAATPAGAVVTTFASFNASSSGNVVWVNNGTGGNNSNYRSNGTGGTIFTTNSAGTVRPALAVAGGVGVTFSFLNALSAFVTNAPAIFTLSASVTNSPAQTAFGFKFEQGISGTFSFISTAPINAGNLPCGACTNLLSGTFTSIGTIAGQSGGTSGALTASGNGLDIVYTSDFLDFSNTLDRDFSLSLSSIVSQVSGANAGLNNATGKALRSFRATATGSFSSDPAPLIPGIPEPQTWALLVVGFGMVGLSARRRSRTSSVAA